MTLVIDRAFRGAAALVDSNCPQERTDVDGSTGTDLIDVGLMINVAFRGANKTSEFDDDGCSPGKQQTRFSQRLLHQHVPPTGN